MNFLEENINKEDNTYIDSTRIKRLNIKEMDDILGYTFKVLDKGFIRVIDYMGSDESVVQAARVSYGYGTKKINEDSGLIRYLISHSHTTPFEMCEIKFHIKVPIFIARQWIRHRTANINEYSARYSIMKDEYYVPELDEIGVQSEINKQCRDFIDSSDEIDKIKSYTKDIINKTSKDQYDIYKQMLDKNIAREIARMSLTLNYYTEFYWKIDAHNLMHFLNLRSDNHAQYEIRVYAEKMLEIFKIWMPITYEAFLNYKKNSFLLSNKMKDILKRKITGENISFESSGLNKREWNKLKDEFNF